MFFNFDPQDGAVAGFGIGLTMAAERENGIRDGYKRAREELEDKIDAAYNNGYAQGKQQGWRDGWNESTLQANPKIESANRIIPPLREEVAQQKAKIDELERKNAELIKSSNKLREALNKRNKNLEAILSEVVIRRLLIARPDFDVKNVTQADLDARDAIIKKVFQEYSLNS